MLRRVPTRHAKRVLAGRYRACRSPSLSYASVSPSRPNIVRSPFVLHNPAAKRVIEIPRPTPPAVAATRSDSRQLNASHPCSCLPVDIRLHTRLVTGRSIMAYAFSRLRSTFWTSGGNVLPGLRRARPRRRRLARSHSIGRKCFVCVRRQTRGEPRLFIRLAARGCRYLQNPHQILVSGTGPSRIDVDRNISTRAVCSVVRTDGRMSAQLSHQAHESVLGRRYDDPPPP